MALERNPREEPLAGHPSTWTERDIRHSKNVGGLRQSLKAWKHKYKTGDKKPKLVDLCIALMTRGIEEKAQEAEVKAQAPEVKAQEGGGSDGDIAEQANDVPQAGNVGSAVHALLSIDDWEVGSDSEPQSDSPTLVNIDDLISQIHGASQHNGAVDVFAPVSGENNDSLAVSEEEKSDIGSEHKSEIGSEHKSEIGSEGQDAVDEFPVSTWLVKVGISRQWENHITLSQGWDDASDLKLLKRCTVRELKEDIGLPFREAKAIFIYAEDERSQEERESKSSESKSSQSESKEEKWSPNHANNGQSQANALWIRVPHKPIKYIGIVPPEAQALANIKVLWVCLELYQKQIRKGNERMSVKKIRRTVDNNTKSGVIRLWRYKWVNGTHPHGPIPMAYSQTRFLRKLGFWRMYNETYVPVSHGGKGNWSGFVEGVRISEAMAIKPLDIRCQIRKLISDMPQYPWIDLAIDTDDEKEMRSLGLIGPLECDDEMTLEEALALNGAAADEHIRQRIERERGGFVFGNGNGNNNN